MRLSFRGCELECHVRPIRKTIRTDLACCFAYDVPRELTSVLAVQETSQSVCAKLSDERDVLGEQFIGFAEHLCERLDGFWNDYFDPATGTPMIHEPGVSAFSELDFYQRQLGWTIGAHGGCGIVMHPQLGSRWYPGTFVTSASVEGVTSTLSQYAQYFS
mmetsp:Transcript_20888/g.38744  ORF Transcript_20888/g.38744 Transcript_20888/m.38744 type:complete len:160 (-) Transcript_20888:35-514(-)